MDVYICDNWVKEYLPVSIRWEVQSYSEVPRSAVELELKASELIMF